MVCLFPRLGRHKTPLYARLHRQMSSDLRLESMRDSAMLLLSGVGFKFQALSSASSTNLVPLCCGLWLYITVQGTIAEPVVGWTSSNTSGSLNSSGEEKRRS